MNRIIKKLVIILAIQLVLVTYLWWPKSSQTVVQKNLFEGFTPSAVSQIEIWEPQKQVLLEKQGQSWVVPEQYGYAADSQKIADLFQKITEIKTGMLVGQTKPSHERFEVSEDKFQRKVQFQLDGKKAAPLGFFLGSSPQFRNAHIRRLDQDEVFTTNKIAGYDISTQPKDWLEKKLMKAKSEDILEIDIQRGKERFHFVRTEKPKEESKEAAEKTSVPDKKPEFVWLLAGNPVNKSAFDGILRNLGDLRLNEVLGKEEKMEWGLQKPAAQVTVTFLHDGKNLSKTFAIGQKVAENYPIHFSDSEFYLDVPAHQVKAVLEVKKEELLAKK